MKLESMMSNFYAKNHELIENIKKREIKIARLERLAAIVLSLLFLLIAYLIYSFYISKGVRFIVSEEIDEDGATFIQEMDLVIMDVVLIVLAIALLIAFIIGGKRKKRYNDNAWIEILIKKISESNLIFPQYFLGEKCQDYAKVGDYNPNQAPFKFFWKDISSVNLMKIKFFEEFSGRDYSHNYGYARVSSRGYYNLYCLVFDLKYSTESAMITLSLNKRHATVAKLFCEYLIEINS